MQERFHHQFLSMTTPGGGFNQSGSSFPVFEGFEVYLISFWKIERKRRYESGVAVSFLLTTLVDTKDFSRRNR